MSEQRKKQMSVYVVRAEVSQMLINGNLTTRMVLSVSDLVLASLYVDVVNVCGKHILLLLKYREKIMVSNCFSEIMHKFSLKNNCLMQKCSAYCLSVFSGSSCGSLTPLSWSTVTMRQRVQESRARNSASPIRTETHPSCKANVANNEDKFAARREAQCIQQHWICMQVVRQGYIFQGQWKYITIQTYYTVSISSVPNGETVKPQFFSNVNFLKNIWLT
jgi:hypothetical protein